MKNDPTHPDLSPEQLAAFLDGELDAAERSRVEAWLATHPDAASEIDGQRRVARLWADHPPPEPGPAAWTTTLARINVRLPAPRRLPRAIWFGAAAAALLAALFGARLFRSVPPKIGKVDPLPVIEPGDVIVISMDGRDAAALVDAAPPVPQAILPAGQDDVSVMSMESAPRDDGRVPQIGEGNVPMIVAPLARAGGR